MAVVTLMSASGSPGVTSTALGMAVCWPRPVVLVEADPTGGSSVLAGFFRGEVASSRGLIDLALAHRSGALADAVATNMIPIQGATAMLLAGVRNHAQSRSLVDVWEPLLAVLRGLERTGQDVIVDAGRLGLTNSPDALVYGSDLTLLTTRTNLPSLAGARSWANTLHEAFERRGALQQLRTLLIGKGRPYGPAEVAKVLQIPVVATVPWEPDMAEVFSAGAHKPRKFDNGSLVRGLRSVCAAAQGAIAANRAELGTAQTGERA